jgi:hypothetical protein
MFRRMASSSNPSSPAPKRQTPELDEEDILDLNEARTALKHFKERGETPIDLEDAKRRLGLS